MSSTANWTVTGVTNLTDDTYVGTKRLRTIATSADYNDLLNKLPITGTTAFTSIPNNVTLTNPDDANSSALLGLVKGANLYLVGTAINDLVLRNKGGKVIIGVTTSGAPSFTVNTDGSIAQRNTAFSGPVTGTTAAFSGPVTGTTATFTSAIVNGQNVVPQVSSDWTATSGPTQILNKPGISGGPNLAIVANSLVVNRPENTQNEIIAAMALTDGNYLQGTLVGDGVIRTKGGRIMIGCGVGAAPSIICNTDATIIQRATTFPVGLTVSGGTLTVAGGTVLPQVNSDWNATSGTAQILNKPSITSAGSNLRTGGYTATTSLGASATTTVTITFPAGSFTTAPIVMISPGNKNVSVTLSAVSATSFDVSATNNNMMSGAIWGFNWMAAR